MSIVRANGLSVHVEQLRPPEVVSGVPGGGPTAVLIHGLATDNLASWYLSMARPLAAAGLRVIMYDLRGHGKTERPSAGYTLDHFVDDLAALLTVLDVTGPVHLLGNSFGGTIAISYAARHPEQVAAIAAVESSPPTAAWFERVAKRLAAAAAQLPHEHVLARISAERGERASRRARTARDVLVATSLAHDLPASRLPAEERIAAIRCPVLWVYGGSSAVVELAPDVQRLLPHARIVTVPGQRHSILIDQPDTVGDIVLSWLRQDCGLQSGPVDAATGRDGRDRPPSPTTLH
ncbi:alpha/beta hydrolase [Micromonospora echinospora]|uniref:Lysophospholipase, alpha-beta hydrolase superfamily n=1 Tax=Micromonospora echinospora TaxID=1877 RepID=A0A1C4ZI96_MICEC|nr:alpha/beta hydrolase [Micromonospora echinospora]OZV76979.1 alpha/beta hydrolase [Micromonospora echinospora]SCF32521.1 Lysophospholipase, alpha-beta hydrolase superfamily [Micromonospora echinospora]